MAGAVLKRDLRCPKKGIWQNRRMRPKNGCHPVRHKAMECAAEDLKSLEEP